MRRILFPIVIVMAGHAMMCQAQTQAPAQAPSQTAPVIPSLQQAQNGPQPAGGGASGARPLPPVSGGPSSQPAPIGNPFEDAKQQIYPLTPSEVRKFIDYVEQEKRASRAVVKTVPVTTGITLDLTPGSAPQFVRAAPFHGATINFVDAMGNGWPVKHVTNYSPGDFDVAQPFEGASSITIGNLGSNGEGNIAVWLVGLESSPIPISLYGGQSETDALRSFRVPRMGPSSHDIAPASAPATAANVDRRLGDILEGVIPAAAQALHTSDPEVRAWQLDDMLVIRTKGMLMSQFKDRVPSADGTAVYSLAMTPQLTVSINGKPHQVTIEF